MIKLRYKLSLFNILSKLIFGVLFLILMPMILERVNTIQTDNQLIEKREQVIDIISQWGVERFTDSGYENAFGSYNILKEEYISLEKVELEHNWNFIEVTRRMIDNQIIDYRVLNYSFYVDGQMYLLEIGKSLASIQQTEKNIQKFTLVFLAVFLVFSTIFDIVFATKLIHPLEKIIKKLKNTPTPSLYGKATPNTTTSEFVYLDKTLEELMQKIEDLFQKERQITSNISHELLTPVSIARGILENLLSSGELNEEAAIKTEESLRTLYRLKTMVNSLLLIARVESHQYLRNESFSMVELINEVKSELDIIAEDKDIALDTDLKEEKWVKNANRSLLFNMFYNIVNNAIKFTPQKGKIFLTSGTINTQFFISIRDTGIGMSPEILENLFMRFKNRSAHPENGTGIGLAISKTIADFHSIEIHVESEPGKGTEFIFKFPS